MTKDILTHNQNIVNAFYKKVYIIKKVLMPYQRAKIRKISFL